MARIKLECPECHLTGSVDEERFRMAGMKFRCPRCGEVHEMAAPTENSEPVPEATAGISPSTATAPQPDSPPAETPGPPSSAAEVDNAMASAAAPEEAQVTSPAGNIEEAGPPPSSDKPAAADPNPYSLLFHGRGGPLFGIQIKNMILSLLTLGFYRFWGKIKVRQYLYSQTELLGDRLLFSGTGKELLVGWGKAVALIFVAFMLFKGLEILHPAFVILTNLGFLVVIGFAKVGSMRYRLSRTSLRAIRFSFRGGYKEGIGLFVGGALLTVFTLGLYYPFFRTKLRRFWFANSYYGTTPFSYTGEGKDLFRRYLLALPLTLFTFGIYWFWFKAVVNRYDWEHTFFPGVRFASTITGGGLCKLQITNLLLLLFTFGLAMPWVVIRSLNFRFHHLSMTGQPDFARISQEMQAAQATGEGLADYMDMDFGVLDFSLY